MKSKNNFSCGLTDSQAAERDMVGIVFTTLRKWLEISREILSSLLFPPRCPICDEILTPEEAEKGIHLACENKLYPVEGAVCMHCGRPLGHIKSQRNNIKNEYGFDDSSIPEYIKPESAYEYCRECQRKGYVLAEENTRDDVYRRNQSGSNITQAKSLYLYKGAVKNSMYRLKYANKREYARFYARQAVEKYSDWLGVPPSANSPAPARAQRLQPPQVIIPVPMYRPKQKQRGYNQAEVFARELSRLTGIPVDKDCIRRVKDTKPQKGLNDTERKNNLENAFQKGKSIVQYSHILIVDDIYTTGYTAEAVAKELRKQGGHRIYLLSVCIGGNN